MIESALTVRFTSLCSSASLLNNRSFDEPTRLHATFASTITWDRCPRLNKATSSILRRKNNVTKIRATIEHLDSSSSDPNKNNEGSRYHPSEDIADSKTPTIGEEARLTPPESTRTIIEVNSKATVMFTSLMNGEVHENVIWPDLPYVTDEHGSESNIYFQVKNDEDVLQTLTSDDNFVQVIIGYDTTEMIKEMESSGSSEIDFEIEGIDDEDSGDEDEEGDDDDEDYDGVASDDPIDWMQHPPAGLAIQGLLRPAFIQEHSDIQKHLSANKSPEAETDKGEKVLNEKLEDNEVINGHKREELGLSKNKDDTSATPESEKDEKDEKETPKNGASFYKLEMMRIQLITAHGQESDVEVEDVRKAQPDAIAHSAVKIISRLKDGGEKTIQAFKALCWRCKGIQVELSSLDNSKKQKCALFLTLRLLDQGLYFTWHWSRNFCKQWEQILDFNLHLMNHREACIIGVDSFGFDLRACSGTQILTLRFSFNTRATSEYSAERQLNDLLFPRIHKSQKQTQAHQNEC
ncbi:hypothetical protein ACFE04_027234 [Oxalis oulophora]